MALRPLAMVTSAGSFMSRFALHLTQYASTAIGVGIRACTMASGVEREAKVAGKAETPLLEWSVYQQQGILTSCVTRSEAYAPLP